MNAPIVVVGKRKFAIGMMPPEEAIEVHAVVMRVAGEPFLRAFATAKEKGADNETAMETAGVTAMGGILQRMDAKDIKFVLNSVFAYCSCDGQPININATFMGRVRDMYLAGWEALKVNLSDFFPADLLSSPLGGPTSTEPTPPT